MMREPGAEKRLYMSDIDCYNEIHRHLIDNASEMNRDMKEKQEVCSGCGGTDGAKRAQPF